ncbi:hypothetical protein A5789_34695 [Nocardia sp. 852002-51101_SCH5132738]|nr:hypothetical protein A5789_34695 [Nocardia sp. 852002-51101_SCH5132738]OBF68015.1 hypothetical protein A9X06_35165 [Mycobacterium sp. 852002-51759_SCH5129042]
MAHWMSQGQRQLVDVDRIAAQHPMDSRRTSAERAALQLLAFVTVGRDARVERDVYPLGGTLPQQH